MILYAFFYGNIFRKLRNLLFSPIAPVTDSAYNKRMKSNKNILSTILFIFAGICILAAVILFVKGHMADRRMEESLDELRPTALPKTVQMLLRMPQRLSLPFPQKPWPEETTVPTEEFDRVPNPYADSFAANGDMAAWLQIPDTNIDYPVMWTQRTRPIISTVLSMVVRIKTAACFSMMRAVWIP